jgi:uncharacterized protein YgiM (DUF1202 family)
MMKMKRNMIAKLLIFLVLMIPCCSVLVSAATDSNAESTKASFTSVTANNTKLYRGFDKNNVILTIPKGVTVKVLNTKTGKDNTCQVRYKGVTGFVDAADIVDGIYSSDFGDDMSGYYISARDYNIRKAPGFYARAKKNASVYQEPDKYSAVAGTIGKGAVVGVYGTDASGFYTISYKGKRSYVLKSVFAKASPVGTNLYVSSTDGGRLREKPVIRNNNIIDTLPYKLRVTVLSSLIGSDDFRWYRVLAVIDDEYYVEGYMREDVLSRQEADSSIPEPTVGGASYRIDTGTGENAVLRDGPNGRQIGSIPNRTVVYATGKTSKAGGRMWAEIASPKKGWIAASFIFKDNY